MKKIFLLSLLGVLTFFSTAQTTLSDIINIYASVTDIDSCTGTLTVEKSTGFTVSMDIILIQMKGAVINTSNTANFGTISKHNILRHCYRLVYSINLCRKTWYKKHQCN